MIHDEQYERDLPLVGDWPSFVSMLDSRGRRLARSRLSTLQVNVGKQCNQACHHCHVDAGPSRLERMERSTAERIVELLGAPGSESVNTLDITGGAPELNPSFRFLVGAARQQGKTVIDRCNLTVLLEPGQESTAEFLAEQRVVMVASLPCYTEENVDRQRGRGAFAGSIEALRRLNRLGYGLDGTGLELQLVYNPLGPSLPPSQSALEADYKRRLYDDHGIVFSRLLTMTNLPISRFRSDIERSGRLEEYMQLLADRFNDATVEQVMCRELVSVGWDGRLYDCDFNQMLDTPVCGSRQTIWEIASLADLHHSSIAVGDHCFGCTAGAGSSCGGALQQ